MEIKIIERKENKLLSREEIYVIIEHPGQATPTREELRKKIAAMLGVDEKLVVVKKILSAFGMPVSRAYINVYKDENVLRRVEPLYILKRNKLVS